MEMFALHVTLVNHHRVAVIRHQRRTQVVTADTTDTRRVRALGTRQVRSEPHRVRALGAW